MVLSFFRITWIILSIGNPCKDQGDEYSLEHIKQFMITTQCNDLDVHNDTLIYKSN